MSSWSALLQPGCHSERELNSTRRGRKQEVSPELGVKTWSFYPFPGNYSNSALSDLSLDPHPYSPLGCQWICDQPGQILSIYIHLDYWDSLILVFSWVMLLLKHNENSCVFTTSANFEGFPGGTSGKESTCPCGRWKRLGFDSWVQKIPWRRAWQHPVQYSYLENPMDRGAWKATIHRVTKSWSWLSGWACMLAWISSAWGGSVQGTLCCRAPVHALRATPLPLCWEGETISQSFSWRLLLFMWTLMGCLHLFFFFGYTPPFSSVQSLSYVRLFATPWTAARQASLSITNSGTYSNSCLSCQWCHSTISFSVVPFSSCLRSFPASGSFPMSQLFASGGQSVGVSASASVLPVNIQDRFPLGLTGWISLQSKGLSRVFSSTTVQKHQFFSAQLSL